MTIESKLGRYLKEGITLDKTIDGYKDQKTVKCCKGCKYGVTGYEDEHTCDYTDNDIDVDVNWYGICPKFKAADVTI